MRAQRCSSVIPANCNLAFLHSDTFTAMIPVFLITGALGSGKTTFLRNILSRPLLDGESAVIVNDFGDLMFDGLLLGDQGTDIVELPGGCICCSAADEFRGVVRRVLERRPARLFVEASGIAETAPFRDDLHLIGLTAQATICLVDCANFDAIRTALPSVDEQISAADVFLLSKTDLADAGAIAALESHVRSRRPGAFIARLKQGYLPAAALQILFATHGDFVPVETANPRLFDHGVFSCIVSVPEAVDAQAVAYFLDNLPPEVVRCKGVLRVRGEHPAFVADDNAASCAFYVNAVCGRWEAAVLDAAERPAAHSGELLLIYTRDIYPELESHAKLLPRATPRRGQLQREHRAASDDDI